MENTNTLTSVKSDNELIAEFMGLIRREANSSYSKAQYYKPCDDKRKIGDFVAYFDGLGYDEKWGRLMPVAEKIGELDDLVEEFLSESGEPLPTIFFTIAEVHEFFVKFIKFYNTTTNENGK